MNLRLSLSCVVMTCLIVEFCDPLEATASDPNNLKVVFFNSNWPEGRDPCKEYSRSEGADPRAIDMPCVDVYFSWNYIIRFGYEGIGHTPSQRLYVECEQHKRRATYPLPEKDFLDVLQKFAEWSELNKQVKKPVQKRLVGFEDYPALFTSLTDGRSYLEFLNPYEETLSLEEWLGLSDPAPHNCRITPDSANNLLLNQKQMRDARVALEAQWLMKRKQEAIPDDPFK